MTLLEYLTPQEKADVVREVKHQFGREDARTLARELRKCEEKRQKKHNR